MAEPVLLNSSLPVPAVAGQRAQWGSAAGCSAALAIAELAASGSRSLLILTPSVAEAEALAADIGFFATAGNAPRLLPDIEVLPYDCFSPHQDLVAQRLRILRDLRDSPCFLLTAAGTLLQRLPPRSYLAGRAMRLAPGQALGREQFCAQLEDAGYQRISQVTSHGEYAVRGSIVDVFPTAHARPVRVDFFDDQVDTLREFDPDSQRSAGQIDALETLPAREMPADAEAIRGFRERFRQRFEGNPARSEIYREVSDGRLPPGIENYLPLFHAQTATLWDYLPEETLVVCVGDIAGALDSAWQQVEERFEQSRGDPERPALNPDELFSAPAEHTGQFAARPMLQLERHALPAEILGQGDVNLPAAAPPPMLINRRDEAPTAGLRRFLAQHELRVLFAAETAGRRELIAEALRRDELRVPVFDDWQSFTGGETALGITVAAIERGTVLREARIAILTEQELFGDKPGRRRRRRRVRDPETLINDLTDLREGAPVVHEEHGIGRYIGLTRLDIGDTETEFVTLEYAGGDRLHVPVAALHLISRYTGASPEHAPLHRLGSDQWARSKRRAAEKVRDVAAELLDLYATRAARPGRPAPVDPADYEVFSAGFPFETTDDQQHAIEDVIRDLAASTPMDRLVCGDVGFGKTEVALRAAFAAVSNNLQVAVLVPTTLLAQQHYQTFCDRFADWPVSVEMLSRFQSQGRSRETVAALAAGKVDIVIGTHRLLQPGISFRNLGLVIIDEEHRFGVRHKERLKALRKEVDILTLTATPIPRTLNMSLGGLRELSLIATPPEARLSIKTFVTPWNDRVIREACLRELKRGGQVYFVHNRVEDIAQVAERVAELVPEASTETAHGQMRERDLERIMLDFYHRRFHILVCTAIIESGLDVPTANTIIIDRADRFGLAQLHQLRGRVGRSHHQAFAYLLAPPPDALTADARKRLEAIESLEDLGAGFVLATHDLEIRGAGELLGEDQSGQIQEIGFALYNEMLLRTVEALRNGAEPALDTDLDKGPEINLHVPALLPDEYLPDVHLRLVHYKRIASARNEQALEELQVELIDRFGLLPTATRNLFRLTRIRLRAAPLGIRRVDIGAAGGRIEFAAQTSVNPAVLVSLIESEPERYRLDRDQRLRISDELDEAESRFEFAENLMEVLASA